VTDPIRVFVNAVPVDVPAGASVRAALEVHDPALAARAEDGAALVTDARGLALPLESPLGAGAIVRVVVRARRGDRDPDAHA
jgi:hypothetical protein